MLSNELSCLDQSFHEFILVLTAKMIILPLLYLFTCISITVSFSIGESMVSSYGRMKSKINLAMLLMLT